MRDTSLDTHILHKANLSTLHALCGVGTRDIFTIIQSNVTG